MTIAKPLITIASLMIAAIFGGGVYLMMNMDSLAKNLTEKIASDALGVAVNVGTMDINLQERSVSVGGLTIANPEGFEKPHALSISTINVALDSISQKLIHFKNIDVKGTNVFLEVQPNGTNLLAIHKGMTKKSADKKQNTKEKKTTEQSPANAKNIKVIIDQFAFASAQLDPTITLVSTQDLQPIEVPAITLSNIGTKENGVLAHEAITQIWTHLNTQFSDSANSAGFYNGLAGDALKDLVGNNTTEIQNRIQNELHKVGEKLKSLF